MAKSEGRPNQPKADGQEGKSDVALREEAILSFWKENTIFEKSLEKEAPNGEFVFYDGPPFATGLPHSGSLLSSVVKDIFPRYKTMRGYHVRRRWGWDCHGLPIENMIEKELGLKTKKDIEELGIDKFNEACRESVLRYDRAWREYIDKVGRWVDFDNSYKTMDNTYIESVWWGLKQMHEKDLLYEGRKVLLYCPHCETPLAKAEVNMDSDAYRDISEEAVTIKFKVKDPEKHDLPENTYLLAWTTTPWTLPDNVALAVGEDIEYVVVTKDSASFVLAKAIYEKGELELLHNFSVEKTIKGKDLVNIEYEPLYLLDGVKDSGKSAHYVALADFVTTEEGTGIVHTAVIYGEDDYELGVKLDLPMVPILSANGHFTDAAPELVQGKYFKQSEKIIKEDLEKRELLFEKKDHVHSYPHCHRCGTQLLYNAITSWFVNVQKIKEKLVKNNEAINWFPEHLKHGRFLHNIENAPDWTISRNRYWASPMPIWKNEKGDLYILGSLEELKQKTKTSGNTYHIMRHGEAVSNTTGILNADPSTPNPLTEKGKADAQKAAKKLKGKNIDLIFHSPLERTKETAEIVAGELGLSKEAVVEDKRLREVTFGEFEGKSIEGYHSYFDYALERLIKRPENGETWAEVKSRMAEILYEIENTYQNKKVLIISHNGALRMLQAGAAGLSVKECAKSIEENHYDVQTGQVLELSFVPLPHNKEYELDLHRPYIDEIELVDEKGSMLTRIPEVLDGWVESGSMPFAEYHYPFENKDAFEKNFPADFIAEYIAQTRTWFYYMHVVATALFGKPSFKNVVTTGNILAEDGNKMSKSKKNYTDPLELITTYGADAYRYYFLTSVVMQAEDLRFTDRDVAEIQTRMINILFNVFKFYDLYKADYDEKVDPYKSGNVLDQWILTRLNDVVSEATTHLDAYNTVKAGRPFRDFVTDFSTWYIRRSRDRFKQNPSVEPSASLQDSASSVVVQKGTSSSSASPRLASDSQLMTSGDLEEDKKYALATTRHVLITFSKLAAPFMPFIADYVYREVTEGKEKESVHLETWPETQEGNASILGDMEAVRDIVTLGLEARSEAGVKVRQPLAKLSVKNEVARIQENIQLLDLIKAEVNVKEVVFDSAIETEVFLDTTITEELKEEGAARAFTRHVQELRKKKGCTPEDRVTLRVKTDVKGEALLTKYKKTILKTALLKDIVFEECAGEEVVVEGVVFVIAVI